LVTLGVYQAVWYYKVNREVRDYDPEINVSPTAALLAVLLGGLLCIVIPIVSIVRTGTRIQQAQKTASVKERCSGGLGILLAFLLSLHVVYYQSQLNKVWDQHGNLYEGTFV
jgi:hypothetical protein